MAKQSRNPDALEPFLQTIPDGRPVSLRILNVAIVRKGVGPEVDPTVEPTSLTPVVAPCVVYIDVNGNTRFAVKEGAADCALVVT